jgi:HK97 family phage portal protein
MLGSGDYELGYSLRNGQLVFNSGYVSATKALKYSDVFAVVNKLSEDMASVHFQTDNSFTKKVLTNPSHLTNSFAFWRSMYAQMLLTGNSYAYIWGDKSNRSDHLEYLKPSQVNIYKSGDGENLTYDLTFPDTQEPDMNNVPSSQIIHLKTMSIDGGLVGISPLSALSKELQLQDANKGLALDAMKNGLNISGILKLNRGDLSNPKIRNSVRNKFEETSKNGHTIVLDALEDYQSLEINKDISKLLSSTDWTGDQIAKVYGVPQDYLGTESEHSNIEQVAIQYSQTIGRYIRGVQSELSLKLNGNIDYDINQVSDIDGQQVENRVSNLVKNGVISSELAQNILLKSNSDLLTVEAMNETDNPLPPVVTKTTVTEKGGDNSEQDQGNQSRQ